MGGQAGTGSRIRNFLGFPAGISGDELAERAYQQAWMFGAGFVFINGAAGLSAHGEQIAVTLADGGQVTARAGVLATGVTYRQLDTPGVAGLIGAGVFYGSAMSEAPALKDQDIFIVGAGNSTGQAVIYLAKSARSATLLVRGDSLAQRRGLISVPGPPICRCPLSVWRGLTAAGAVGCRWGDLPVSCRLADSLVACA